MATGGGAQAIQLVLNDRARRFSRQSLSQGNTTGNVLPAVARVLLEFEPYQQVFFGSSYPLPGVVQTHFMEHVS